MGLCDAYDGGDHCGLRTERRYLDGWRCPLHPPTPPTPDPARTAVGLASRRLPKPDQSRYGTATADPLGRTGPGWTTGKHGLPVRVKGDKGDTRR